MRPKCPMDTRACLLVSSIYHETEVFNNNIFLLEHVHPSDGKLVQHRAPNRPRSIYQYSNMAPRLSGQNSIFGVVFFVSKSLLGIERQKKLEKFAILTRKPRSHARILIYRTWPIMWRSTVKEIPK